MGVSVDRKKIFVDGDFDEGANDGWREVLNPATCEVIAEVPECFAEDVDRAVGAARKAFGDGPILLWPSGHGCCTGSPTFSRRTRRSLRR